jgi:hypothetical protein
MKGDMNESKSEGERQAIRIDSEMESKVVDGNGGSGMALGVSETPPQRLVTRSQACRQNCHYVRHPRNT